MTFCVGLSDDLFDSRGEPSFGRAPLSILDEAHGMLTWERLPPGLATVTPDLTAAFDALYVNVPGVDRVPLPAHRLARESSRGMASAMIRST